MPSLLVHNMFNPGKYNNYVVGGNLCNAFALGELGSSDDFFLIGAEPAGESNYPLLTGNILDSEGQVLFRLVRNMLVINPGHCSRILSDHVGYEIYDSAGKQILGVRTMFETLAGESSGQFVTRISANFFNKNGELVFKAHASEGEEKIESSVKAAFGFNGSFGAVLGYSDEEAAVAAIALSSGGRVHQLLTGHVHGKSIELDGKILRHAHLDGCKVLVRTGDFVLLGEGNIIEGCEFDFAGPARNVAFILEGLGKAPAD